MKKVLAILLTAAMLLLALSACGGNNTPADTDVSGGATSQDDTQTEAPDPKEVRRAEVQQFIKELVEKNSKKAEDPEDPDASFENPLAFLDEDYSVLGVEDNAFGVKGLLKKSGCTVEIYDGSDYGVDALTFYYVPAEDYVVHVAEAGGQFEYDDYSYNDGSIGSLLSEFNFSLLTGVSFGTEPEEPEDGDTETVELTEPTEEDYIISEDLNSVSLSENYLKTLEGQVNDLLKDVFLGEAGTDETAECPISASIKSFVIDVDSRSAALAFDLTLDPSIMGDAGILLGDIETGEDTEEPAEPMVFTVNAEISDVEAEAISGKMDMEGSFKIDGTETALKISLAFENIKLNEEKNKLLSAKIGADINVVAEDEEVGKSDMTFAIGVDLDNAEEGKEKITLSEATSIVVEQLSSKQTIATKNTLTIDRGNSSLEYEAEENGSTAKLVATDVKFGDDVTFEIPAEVTQVVEEVLPQIIAYEGSY